MQLAGRYGLNGGVSLGCEGRRNPASYLTIAIYIRKIAWLHGQWSDRVGI